MSDNRTTASDAVKAIELAQKIDRKTDEVLYPLLREMRVMKWPAEYRAIMWNTIARKAMKEAQEAAKDVQ